MQFRIWMWVFLMFCMKMVAEVQSCERERMWQNQYQGIEGKCLIKNAGLWFLVSWHSNFFCERFIDNIKPESFKTNELTTLVYLEWPEQFRSQQLLHQQWALGLVQKLRMIERETLHGFWNHKTKHNKPCNVVITNFNPIIRLPHSSFTCFFFLENS